MPATRTCIPLQERGQELARLARSGASLRSKRPLVKPFTEQTQEQTHENNNSQKCLLGF